MAEIEGHPFDSDRDAGYAYMDGMAPEFDRFCAASFSGNDYGYIGFLAVRKWRAERLGRPFCCGLRVASVASRLGVRTSRLARPSYDALVHEDFHFYAPVHLAAFRIVVAGRLV